jgi:UDP-glucose 4-epimerase
MKVLITGGAGYIGSSLSFFLLDRKNQVTIIDNLSTGHASLIPKKALFYKCDISDEKKITKILKNNYDIVIHLAAYTDVQESIKNPRKYLINNYLKSKKFINLCLKNGVNKFLFSSTAAVYGNNKKKVSEDSKINILSPYAFSKYKVERFLEVLGTKKKIDYIILRYFNVAGIENKFRTGDLKKNLNLIRIVCLAALNKIKKIIIYGNNYFTKDGTPVRDFIHIEDLCSMHYVASKYLLKHSVKKIFNCGYGNGYSVYEIILLTLKLFNKKINYNFGKIKKGDISYSVSNPKKFISFFKWMPKYNNMKKILISSYLWEKRNKNNLF